MQLIQFWQCLSRLSWNAQQCWITLKDCFNGWWFTHLCSLANQDTSVKNYIYIYIQQKHAHFKKSEWIAWKWVNHSTLYCDLSLWFIVIYYTQTWVNVNVFYSSELVEWISSVKHHFSTLTKLRNKSKMAFLFWLHTCMGLYIHAQWHARHLQGINQWVSQGTGSPLPSGSWG